MSRLTIDVVVDLEKCIGSSLIFTRLDDLRILKSPRGVLVDV